MEYTIKQLAEMAGISSRTLRYYHQIGLLLPVKMNASGYRVYGEKEVDALQQILFYKEMGLELSTVKSILSDDGFEPLSALRGHLQQLTAREHQLKLLIENVKKTIQKEEGKRTMTNHEKFEGFKEEMIQKNEEEYGEVIREKYGKSTIENSNAKIMGLTEEQFGRMGQLDEEIKALLKAALQSGANPGQDKGKEIARLHREWLSYTWSDYSKEAHMGLADMYVADERFKAYYDGEVEGCAAFLRDAVKSFCKE